MADVPFLLVVVRRLAEHNDLLKTAGSLSCLSVCSQIFVICYDFDAPNRTFVPLGDGFSESRLCPRAIQAQKSITTDLASGMNVTADKFISRSLRVIYRCYVLLMKKMW